MKRYTLIALLIYSSVGIAKELSAVQIREIATRNLPIEPAHLISLCDDEENLEWCKGYYSATAISLMSQGMKLCMPVNDVNRYIFDGVWTLTKAWLYKQEKNTKITFFQAVKNSLTYEAKCK